MGLFLWLYICAGFCNHIIVCLWGHEILRGILTCIWIAANCVGPPLKKILRHLTPHWFQHPVHPTGSGPQSLAAEIQSTDVCTWLQERCQLQWARVMLPQQFLSCHCRAVPLLPCCRGSACMENPPLLSDSVLVILFFTNRRWLSLQFAQQLIVPLTLSCLSAAG